MPSKALHATANVASSEFYPTTPQMMEFYEQVRRGDITKSSFQAFIRGELVRKPKQATQPVKEEVEDPVSVLDSWCENHLHLGGFTDEFRKMMVPFFNPAKTYEPFRPPEESYAASMSGRKDYYELVKEAIFWKKTGEVQFVSVTKTSGERINVADRNLFTIESEMADVVFAQQVRTQTDLNADFLSEIDDNIDRQFAFRVFHRIEEKMNATGARYYHLLHDSEINQVVRSVWMAVRKMLAFYRAGDKSRALQFAPFFKLQSSLWPVLYLRPNATHIQGGPLVHYVAYALSY